MLSVLTHRSYETLILQTREQNPMASWLIAPFNLCVLRFDCEIPRRLCGLGMTGVYGPPKSLRNDLNRRPGKVPAF